MNYCYFAAIQFQHESLKSKNEKIKYQIPEI